MISKFVSLFKKSDLDEQRAFQLRVMQVLKDQFPDKEFSPGEDPLMIEHNGQLFGLTNIRSNFLLSTNTDQDLSEIVSEHFRIVLAGVDVEELVSIAWEVAKTQLMPQLMPREYLDRMDLVFEEFGGGIVLGFVLDSENSYCYVTREMAERWGVSDEDITSIASSNLKDRSEGIEVSGVPGPGGLVAVSMMDGFDATRISLPEVRDFVAGIVHFPFYFGVPNRDFLICWAKNNDSDFQNSMSSKLALDFEKMPYPLSPIVFEAIENGEIAEAFAGGKDPRAESAANN